MNSGKIGAKRADGMPVGRPFQPGVAPNPTGRPRTPDELKAAAQAYTTEAIARLGYWLSSDNPKASVTAAEKLLERGWGRATQPIEHSGQLAVSIGLASLLAEADGETKGVEAAATVIAVAEDEA